MKTKIFSSVLFVLVNAVLSAHAQRAEVTISLNEAFFDSLLDAIYQNSPPPEFPLAGSSASVSNIGLVDTFTGRGRPKCSDSVTLLRSNRSTRTAVRFREGKIYAPVAFSGNYSPPFVGCIDFGGYAETNVDLQLDRAAQRLVGRIRVSNVVLDGTAGVGSGLIAKMVQSSIDKKLNPIEIISLDKLSFPFSLPNSTRLKMKATGVRNEIANGALNIVISYEFQKD
jgi:hypothetical protein